MCSHAHRVPKEHQVRDTLVGWTTRLNGIDGYMREVVTNRYININPIGEDKYLPCCGAIKGQGPAENKGLLVGSYV